MTTQFPTASDAGSIDSVAAGLIQTDEDPNTTTEVSDEVTEAAPADEGEEPEAQTDEAPDDAEEVEDDATEEDDAPEEPAQATYTVKVDGKEVSVTLEELTRSYAGQGYIQKRMQETAAIRKEAEATYHALNAERQQLMQALQVYEQQLASTMNPQPPSQELLQTDPIAYLEQDAAYRKATETRQAVHQQMLALQQRQIEDQQRAHAAYLAEQAQVLQQRIPAFADAEKAGSLKKALVETATQTYGYSPEELQGLSDARAVEVLHDAMQYRKLMAGRAEAAKKVAKPAAPVVRPGARRTEADAKVKAEKAARSRMKQTGSVDDVAAFLIQR